MNRRTARFLLPLLLLALSVSPLGRPGAAVAEEVAEAAPRLSTPVPAGWREALEWRSIGPAHMGGRITALAVYEADPTTWWAATASGGLLKTVNNGQSFEHQFEREQVVSIGDVAVAQTNPKIVWIGTGESNPRNSVSYGNGVYKSIDGGTSWTHMGLPATFQTGAIRIHPQNPDIVYVGALGRLWGPNEERGLYKTKDGGKTWERVLFVDAQTGVIDVAMHPTDPDTLLVATYERQRDMFCTNHPAKRHGAGSALWRTTDGGATFKRVTKGLPTCKLGRIGLDFSRKNPDNVFMVLESEKLGKAPADSPYLGITGTDADVGCRLTKIVKKGPAEAAGLKQDDIILGMDGARVHDYAEFIRMARGYVAGDKVKLEVIRERKSQEISLTLGKRPKGGRSPFQAYLNGQNPNLQEQQGKLGHEYGGIYQSKDGGVSWQRINSLNPRPMYFSRIRVDPNDESRLWVLGIRLWRSLDGGKTFKANGHPGNVHVDHHALWIDRNNSRHVILGNDGGIYVTYDDARHYEHLNHVAIGQFYHVGVDHRDGAYYAYGGLQDNGSWGGPIRVRSGVGPTNTDWFRIGGGDGFRCLVDPNDPDQLYFESQNGAVGRRHLATGSRSGFRPRPARGSKEKYRWNWYTPFQLSNHNSRIYYVAGNYVWRSLDRGNHLKRISGDITATKRGSATSFAESPRDADRLYVGTDDGALWTTADGGHTWTDLYAQPKPEAPKPVLKKPAHVDATEQGGDGGEGGDGNEPNAPKPNEPKPDEASPPRGAKALARIMAMDANGDGKLQKSEMPARLEDLFDKADADGDGAVTEAELKVALAARRAAVLAARAEEAAAISDGEAAKAPVAGDPKPAAAKGKKQPVKPVGKPLWEAQPDRRYVSWIEPSRFKAGRVYVAFDGHRSDDDRALIFVSENAGGNWRSIVSDLPASAGTTRHLREDPKNENVLWLGTEMGAYVSLDLGKHWHALKTNLPTVAVHAFAFHPESGEVVAATHGRSLWVLDATPIRQMSAKTMAAKAHLYKPSRAITWRPLPGRGAARGFTGRNPAMGAVIHFQLGKGAKTAKLEIRSADGGAVRELEVKNEAGLQRVAWNLRRSVPTGQQRRRRGKRVKPGTYTVVLTVDGQSHSEPVEVVIDPEHTNPAWIASANAEEAEQDAKAWSKWLKKYAPWRGDD